MQTFLNSLKTGSCLTAQRIHGYSIIFIMGYVLAFSFVLTQREGIIDRTGAEERAIGSDFINVYAAGVLANQGDAPAAYDWQKHHAVEIAVAGKDIGYYGWHYPPFFLFLAQAFAKMPYLPALAVWQITSFAAALGVMYALFPRRETLLLTLAFPAFFINLGHGQNAFLTAALLGGFLLYLPKRPWLAGVLLGLLAYKPQFGVLIPIALLAGGYWRTLISASIMVGGMIALSIAAFGVEIWQAFYDSLPLTKTIVLEQGGTGFHKIQSVFAAVRLWGGSVAFGYIMQGAMQIALTVLTIYCWRRKSTLDYPLKAAILVISSMLFSPYILDYDLFALAPALVLLVQRGLNQGFAPFEKTLLFLVWLMPFCTRPLAEQAFVPLGVISMMLLLWRLSVRDKLAEFR